MGEQDNDIEKIVLPKCKITSDKVKYYEWNEEHQKESDKILKEDIKILKEFY